jgi:ketosteroid isomerase-like protein
LLVSLHVGDTMFASPVLRGNSMLSRLVLTASALVMCSPVFGQDGVKDVEKAIATLNDAFKTGNAETIKSLTTEDHLTVTTWGGTQTREAALKTLPELKLTEYVAGEMKITLLGTDAALVTYPLSMKGTFQGKDVPAKNFASAVWVRKGGKWLEAYYQETPLAK